MENYFTLILTVLLIIAFVIIGLNISENTFNHDGECSFEYEKTSNTQNYIKINCESIKLNELLENQKINGVI